jgi:hypothetical protein
MDPLFKKQEKINKQVNKYTSFANHKRYTNDMKTVQKNIIRARILGKMDYFYFLRHMYETCL